MSLIKNSSWNIVGYAIPAIFAIPALGFIARSLGTELFGVFTLALAIVGYASIFDAGLTRAVTREIALCTNGEENKKNIISTSSCCLLILGGIGALIIFLLSFHVVKIFNISMGIEKDISDGIKLLSIAIPIFLFNQLWLSILEGEENFRVSNIQKMIGNSFIAISPVIFVLIDKTFSSAIMGVIVGRLISLFISFYFNRTLIIKSGLSFKYNIFSRLINFGGWLTVSNILNPIMTVADRFILSNVLGAAHVAMYTAPSEGVSRLSIIPAALSRAMFPRLSRMENVLDRNRSQWQAYKIIFMILFPIVTIGLIYSKSIMGLWMGDEFGNSIAPDVLRVLLIGFFFNAIAHIPYTNIQSLGYSKVTVLIHCLEVVPYFFIFYLLIEKYGVIGAAIAWSLRTSCDFIILFFVSKRIATTFSLES